MGEILYGHILANELKQEIKENICNKVNAGKRNPALAIICVETDDGSSSYIAGIKKASGSVGIDVVEINPEKDESKVISTIKELNDDVDIDGIMILLPLPSGFDSQKVFNAISANKDVDGLSEKSVGRLYTKQKGFKPCTPQGIMYLLSKNNIELEGKEVVVVGRSNSVGKPMAQLMLDENATVTICHSKTVNIQQICLKADILVVAVGKAHLVSKDWIKPNAIVIDVGVNCNEQGKLVGDVDMESALEIARFVTPVTKGVGTLTTAMLLSNVYNSYERRIEHEL